MCSGAFVEKAKRIIEAEVSKALNAERSIKWPKENMVVRRSEMDPNGCIQINLEQDGDVEITVYCGTSPVDYNRATVQFCTGMGGGGRSPRTREAAIRLMKAMEEDNETFPQPKL